VRDQAPPHQASASSAPLSVADDAQEVFRWRQIPPRRVVRRGKSIVNSQSEFDLRKFAGKPDASAHSGQGFAAVGPSSVGIMEPHQDGHLDGGRFATVTCAGQGG
jgi:hypothetical protein